MSEIVLDVQNLNVHFQLDERLIKAVDGVSFQLARGQTLGIVGESGSGKSVTSLAIINLIPQPPGKITGGNIWFRQPDEAEAVDLCQLTSKQLRRYRGGKIATIFQEPMSALNPVYTIGFQLIETIQFHQEISSTEARRKAIALLQEVRLLPTDEALQSQITAEWQKYRQGEPSPNEIQQQVNAQKLAFLDRYPHQLSGGQLQRVTIAMAMSCDPVLLIADEPTTALDVTVQATILELLRELRDRRGMGMIFITHDLGIIAEIADTVAVMYRGKIVELNSVFEIFSNPQHPYTKGLLACSNRTRRLQYLPTISDFMEEAIAPDGQIEICEKNSANLQVVEISEVEAAERLAYLYRQAPLLKVEQLKVGFPLRGMFGQTKQYFMAVNDVSFEVYPGETLGLVGESGCGKTTLARTLLQLMKPLSGTIEFAGQNIHRLGKGGQQQLRRDMQIIFQDPFSSLDPRMSIAEAVMEPLKLHARHQDNKKHRDRVAYLLERVGLNPDWMNRFPHEFSGGQRQRICIARSLALNPRFIICDESVSALDVSVQAQVLNLLKELQSEFGLTYIFISHDLSVVKFMSDRIMVMNKGKIEEIGAAEVVYRHPQTDYTRQLIASIPTGSLERIQELRDSSSRFV